jgi:anti-anti-sigma factor
VRESATKHSAKWWMIPTVGIALRHPARFVACEPIGDQPSVRRPLGSSAVRRSTTGTAADLVGDLVIDIGLLTLIDSTGLSLLVSLHKKVRASGHAFTVADPTPMARRLFQIKRLDQVLPLGPPL